MAKKKNKKQNLGPKRKRMNQSSRLASAKDWIKTYTGTNIIKGYANWYGVEQICAMTELEMLGQSISETTKAKTKKAAEDRIRQKKLQQEKENRKGHFSKANSILTLMKPMPSSPAIPKAAYHTESLTKNGNS